MVHWVEQPLTCHRYERYLNIDDEEVFSHLLNLSPRYEDYTAFVQRLILSQLRGRSHHTLDDWS